MMLGFNDGSKSQYQRIHELLLSYYPYQEDERGFENSAMLTQALAAKENPVYQDKWKQYLASVKEKTKGVLRFSPSDFCTILMPALGGNFTLKREKANSVIYRRRFKVYLSLIGSFYTMFGQDEVMVETINKPKRDDEFIVFDPVIYPVPYDIYEPWFLLIQMTIAEVYPGYEFVPYQTLRYRLKDVSTGYSGKDGAPPSVFQALFSTEDINQYRTRTDLRKNPFEVGEFD